jgi:5-methyltetrahydrofolate--homocysteine methyltransferase
MQLEHKADFDDAAAQWIKFWQGTNTRPAVSAVRPKKGVKPVEKPPYASGSQGDFAPIIDQLLAWAETHEFLADAIPFYYLEFGADHFAALLGADLTFTPGDPAGWAVPCVPDLASAEIRFDRSGTWWQRTVEFAQALRARCDGRVMIAANTLVSNLDALAALHGSQNLLMAMVETPDAVHRALAQIDKAHGEVLTALGELLGYREQGSITRHGMYARGPINVPQCDFSCMISPEMFREFVVPYLRQEMRRYDGVEYHLDGPDAIRHLEALCGLPELDVIQWVPGTGNPEKQDWTLLFDRIDALGKGQIRGGKPADVCRIWQQYRSRAIFFGLQAESQTEVEDCLAALETATSKKPA